MAGRTRLEHDLFGSGRNPPRIPVGKFFERALGLGVEKPQNTSHTPDQSLDAWMSLLPLSESFDRIADRYDRHAALEKEVCDRLVERTDFSRLEPRLILDLGSGTGYGAQRLKKRHRQARLVGLDASPGMLSLFRKRSSLLRPLQAVCGDLSALPFSDRSADMVFCNLATLWGGDAFAVFSEFRRVLRPEGMLLFSSLGPGSLGELRQSFSRLQDPPRIPEFPDLLELGDALVKAGFSEPVMDADKLSLHYRSTGDLKAELEGTGSALLIRDWGRLNDAGEEWTAAYAPLKAGDRYPLGFEVIYGTAFGPAEGQPRRTEQGEIATFSVESLRRTGRRNK